MLATFDSVDLGRFNTRLRYVGLGTKSTSPLPVTPNLSTGFPAWALQQQTISRCVGAHHTVGAIYRVPQLHRDAPYILRVRPLIVLACCRRR